MARYPTFDEYAKRGAYNEGVNRCNELLQRMPKDVQLLLVKLQLLAASSQKIDETLDQLLAIQPPIQDLRELVPIEAAVVDANKDTWPRPVTAGPQVAKLWDNAFKANTNLNHRLNLLTLRFSRAILDDRIQDAQQSLISLKTVQPKNRAIYMAHAAYTQLLSNSKDDLQSRLALSLAKKAVAEKFDDDRALDCRVAGQIFAKQRAEAKLETIRERPPFRESKQVYEALKLSEKVNIDGSTNDGEVKDPAKVPSRIWLMSEVEAYKNNFKALIEAKAPANNMPTFAESAIRLFELSVASLDLGKRDRPAADACFVAVSGLIKLFVDRKDPTYLLQAAFLAEQLLQKNENIHEARMILVYLYMRLNLGSLAIRYFDSLNVKEIQHDTVGHSLFAGLSIVHPHWTALAGRDWFEPHERTHKALGIYPRHEDKLADTEAGILEHSQTGMIFDLHELRGNLRSSVVRRMILLEHRRIARLTGKNISKSVSDIGPRVVANWTNIVDNRDFNATFNYGLNVEESLFPDNTCELALTSLLSDLSADTAWSLATGKPSALILDPENLPAASTQIPDSKQTPPARILSSSITHQTVSILTSVKAGTSPTKETISSLLESVQDLHIDFLTSLPGPLAQRLDHYYLFIDTLRIVIAACTYIKKHAEHIPMEVATLQEKARGDIESLQKDARERVKSVKVEGVRESLVKNELKGVIEMFGKEKLEAFAKSIAESTREGWEGVGKINASP